MQMVTTPGVTVEFCKLNTTFPPGKSSLTFVTSLDVIAWAPAHSSSSAAAATWRERSRKARRESGRSAQGSAHAR